MDTVRETAEPGINQAILERLKVSRKRWLELIALIEDDTFDRWIGFDDDREAIINAAYERFGEHVKEIERTLIDHGCEF